MVEDDQMIKKMITLVIEVKASAFLVSNSLTISGSWSFTGVHYGFSHLPPSLTETNITTTVSIIRTSFSINNTPCHPNIPSYYFLFLNAHELSFLKKLIFTLLFRQTHSSSIQ